MGGITFWAVGYAFASKSGLQTAVDAWVSNRASAEVTYGHISTWDVNEVTDMSYLFCGSGLSSNAKYGCSAAKASFNDDISQWNVGKVTNMRVRVMPHRRIGLSESELQAMKATY